MSESKTPGSPLSAVVAKAQSDAAFKKSLLADPAAALSAAGFSIPAGVTVKVVENTENVVHLVLPVETSLSEAQLASVAGGFIHGYTIT